MLGSSEESFFIHLHSHDGGGQRLTRITLNLEKSGNLQIYKGQYES